MGIKISNNLLLFITMVLKKLGKKKILASNNRVFAGSFMKPGHSLMFLKIPGTDGSLNLIFFSNTHQAAFFFFSWRNSANFLQRNWENFGKFSFSMQI